MLPDIVGATLKAFLVPPRLALAVGLALGLWQGVRLPLAPCVVPAAGLDVSRVWRGEDRVHLYRIALEAGDFVRIAVDQRSSEVALETLAPGDSRPSRIDGDTYGSGIEDFELVARRSGEARVEVVLGVALGERPAYRLTIGPVRRAGPADRLRARTFSAVVAAERNSGAARIRGLESALRFAERARARDLRAWVHGRIGMALPSTDERAVEHLQAAAALAVDPARAGAALHRLGGAMAQRARPAEAATAYGRELRLGERTADRFRQAFALEGLGNVAVGTGRFEEAISLYRRAVDLRERLGDRLGEARALNLLGSAFEGVGDPEQAVALYQQGLALASSDLGTRVDLVNAIGSAVRFLDLDRDQVREIDEAALRMARRLGDRRREAACLLTRGELELDLGRDREAIAYFAPAEGILREEVDDPAALAKVQSMLGVASARAGDLARAFDLFDRSLAGYRRLGSQNGRAGVLSRRSDALRQAGRFAAARADLEEAIAIVESLRFGLAPQKGIELLADRHRYFERLVDLLIDRGLPEAAFEASEQARARTLLDEVSGRPITPPRRLAEIRSALGADTVMFAFWLGESRSFLWRITGGKVSVAILPAAATIDAATLAATRAFHAPAGRLASRERPIAEISRLLLGPFAGELRAKRFVIVPDGDLFALPFSALPIPGSGASDPERLIDRAPFVTLPSASLALEIGDAVARRPAAKLGLLAVGDPVFGCPDDRLTCPPLQTAKSSSPLPGWIAAPAAALIPSSRGPREAAEAAGRIARTGSEVTAITRLAVAAGSASRVGFAATRDALLGAPLDDFRILHFATHAGVDPLRPESSGLALARLDREGKPLPGETYFHLGDLAGRRLRADLVVLSACESACGQDKRGEGPQSLGRAFLAAGAANALVSLWRVDDSSTEALMVEFYRRLLELGETPAVALRGAQLAIRARPEWHDPYYWGAFFLEGDWRGEGKTGRRRPDIL